MDYETGKALEALEAQSDFIYKVCQKLNKLVVGGGGTDVFEEIKQEQEEEAKGEEKDDPQPKGKKKKGPLV